MVLPTPTHLPSVTPVCLFTLTNDLLQVMNWELIASVLKRRREQDQKQQPQRLAFPYMYDIHCVWHFAPRQHGDFQTRLLTEGCISWKLLKCMHFVFLETNLRTFLEILQNSIFRISVPEMFPHFSVATHPYQMWHPLKCQKKKTQLIRFYRFSG